MLLRSHSWDRACDLIARLRVQCFAFCVSGASCPHRMSGAMRSRRKLPAWFATSSPPPAAAAPEAARPVQAWGLGPEEETGLPIGAAGADSIAGVADFAPRAERAMASGAVPSGMLAPTPMAMGKEDGPLGRETKISSEERAPPERRIGLTPPRLECEHSLERAQSWVRKNPLMNF